MLTLSDEPLHRQREPAGHAPRIAPAQVRLQLICVQVSPGPLRRMVVARQLPLTVRALPLHPSKMFDLDFHLTLVEVDIHRLHTPRFCKSQYPLVQFDIPHRLDLLGPAVLTPNPPTEKPDGPSFLSYAVSINFLNSTIYRSAFREIDIHHGFWSEV